MSGREKFHRFHVEMPDSLIKDLDQWKAAGGASSRKEVLNTAITALRWMVRETQRGATIVARSPRRKRERELVLPLLEKIRASRPSPP